MIDEELASWQARKKAKQQFWFIARGKKKD